MIITLRIEIIENVMRGYFNQESTSFIYSTFVVQ
jgi:hypothetical protein